MKADCKFHNRNFTKNQDRNKFIICVLVAYRHFAPSLSLLISGPSPLSLSCPKPYIVDVPEVRHYRVPPFPPTSPLAVPLQSSPWFIATAQMLESISAGLCLSRHCCCCHDAVALQQHSLPRHPRIASCINDVMRHFERGGTSGWPSTRH